MSALRWRCALACGVAVLAAGADWNRFRGPDAEGTAPGPVPVTFSATENLAWKTPMPGFGASSPIVVGQRVFLTAYSGYGLDPDAPGDVAQLRYHLLAVNLADGKVVWDRVETPPPGDKEYKGFIALHGYASSTPTSDGQAVYAFFGSSGVHAYSLDGQPLWTTSVGEGTHGWGSATSPILFEDLVIVSASVESQSLVALDKKTGAVKWKVGNVEQSWGTPLVVKVPKGPPELVVSLKDKVLGLDPATGKELWTCAGVPDYICPSVAAHEDVVFITAGRKPETFAVRAGGRGDVTKTRKLWDVKETTKVATPLYHDGHLYWLDNRGTPTCLKAGDGEVVYKERLEVAGKGDKVYASPILVGDKLYCVTRQDGVIVLAVGPQFQKLAQNHLDDDSIFNATPAVAGGRLLIRSDRFLYCIGR